MAKPRVLREAVFSVILKEKDYETVDPATGTGLSSPTRRSRLPSCFARHHGLQEPLPSAGLRRRNVKRGSTSNPGAQMTTRWGRMKSASLVLWKTTGSGDARLPTLFRERWLDGSLFFKSPRHSAARAGTATVSPQGLEPGVTRADRSFPLYEQAYADRHHPRGRNPRRGYGW